MLFSTISCMSTSVNKSNPTSPFFRYACPAVDKNCLGSELLAQIHRLIFI